MTKKSVKTIVHLRVYRGKEMSYDEKGNSRNENQIVKIQSPSIEWNNFLKHLRINGYCKVEVEKVTEVSVIDGAEEIKEVSDVSINEAVNSAFAPIKKVAETPEQKRIAELERKIDELTGGPKKEVKEEKKEVKKEDNPDERASLIEEYKALFGKGIFPAWSNEAIKEKIEAEKQKQ